jgi:dolichol kinase
LAVAAGASVATPAFAILVAIAAVAETARLASPRAEAVLARLAGGAFRPAEARWPSGAGTLALGYALAWWIFPPAVAEAAIVVTALADPAAALVGSRFGRGAAKSLPGSLACACAAALVLAAFRVGPAGLAVAAVGAAVAERAPWRGTDNLAVPLVVGALLRWLQ